MRRFARAAIAVPLFDARVVLGLILWAFALVLPLVAPALLFLYDLAWS